MEIQTGQLRGALSKNFLELSPQLQQAARFILENPEDVATYSLRRIARLSGLTPPTFSRLARAIGFDKYEGLREVCRAELKRSYKTLAQRAHEMQDSSRNPGSFAGRHISSSMENMDALYQGLDLNQLGKVADHLAKAQRVGLVGALSSRSVLEYFHHMMSLARPGWAAMNDSHLSTPALFAELGSSATILVISLRPYIRRTVRIAELASHSGASVISITDDISSPILKHSSHSFLVPTESPQFFPSYIAVLTLLEILAGMLVRRWGDEAKRQIDSVEKMSHAVGDYM